jgi:regulator of sigma E protease
MELLSNAFSILLLIVGFGFVIFWHELGHFLAAKWVGIKVEQFAVGMGHAIVSYRRGVGVKLGNTRKEYEGRIKQYLDAKAVGTPPAEYSEQQMTRAAEELGLGETEYRLSWIPIGGYVKMLGQDDMRPGADAEDPRAFNRKTVPQRMLVVSAGVIMNIILAAVLFMVLFLYGFNAPAPTVGNVIPGSPAQIAGLRVGDTILEFDGQPQHDFTKISLNTALASPDRPIDVKVRRFDTKKEEVLKIQPVRPEGATSRAFLALGILPAPKLEGPLKREMPKEPKNPALELPDFRAIRPGDAITHVDGKAVRPEEFYVLDQAVQASDGKPVELTVKRAGGAVETVKVHPHFPLNDSEFVPGPFSIAGLQPRTRIEHVASEDSPLLNKVQPGDVVKSIAVRPANAPAGQPGNLVPDVSVPGFMKSVGEAGTNGQTVEFVLIRDGKELPPVEVKEMIKLPGGRRGVGIRPAYEEQTPVIAAVAENSPAAKAKEALPAGSLITAVDGKPVKTWFDVQDALSTPGDHALTLLPPNSEKPIQRTLSLSDADARTVAGIRLGVAIALAELKILRQTSNPLTAIGWGALETRDLILQFYVTLQRMFGGTVSPKNLMGPVGIADAGARFAFKGTDWLIWFLAMISANLAVVNFLPIPIVDGGLFLFLIIEKIQGRPLSRRAQEFAQLVGLAMILSVFLMVTYNDIARIFSF